MPPSNSGKWKFKGVAIELFRTREDRIALKNAACNICKHISYEEQDCPSLCHETGPCNEDVVKQLYLSFPKQYQIEIGETRKTNPSNVQNHVDTHDADWFIGIQK